MTTPVARVGDTISHGGSITSGSVTTVDGIQIARVGDTALCTLHGVVTITTGSPGFSLDGQPVARVGSLCSCGATVAGGSPTLECD